MYADNAMVRSNPIALVRREDMPISVKRTSIGHAYDHHLLIKGDLDRGLRSAGMLGDVGQRLLRDAVHGEVEARRHRYQVPAEPVRDLQAGRSALSQQPIHVSQTGRGKKAGLSCIITTEDLEHTA